MKLVYNQQDNNNIIFERSTLWTFGSKDIQRIAILFLSKSATVTQFQKFKSFKRGDAIIHFFAPILFAHHQHWEDVKEISSLFKFQER